MLLFNYNKRSEVLNMNKGNGENSLYKKEKIIAILLDVQRTLNEITDEKAKIFMEQLHELQIKFQASKVLINVSSHMYSPESLNSYLKILNENLIPNIILDDATYFYGTYNYEKQKINERGYGYNLDKTLCFEEKYLEEYDVVWFAIIDDSISEEYVKKFQDNHPMVVCKPSLRFEMDLKYNNFMYYSTKTYGFSGVIECLSDYLKNIKDIRKEEILEKQKNMLAHLSAYEVKMLCINKKFDLLERYLQEGSLDREDYNLVVRELDYLIEKDLSSREVSQIKRMIELLKLYKEDINEVLVLKLESEINGEKNEK